MKKSSEKSKIRNWVFWNHSWFYFDTRNNLDSAWHDLFPDVHFSWFILRCSRTTFWALGQLLGQLLDKFFSFWDNFFGKLYNIIFNKLAYVSVRCKSKCMPEPGRYKNITATLCRVTAFVLWTTLRWEDSRGNQEPVPILVRKADPVSCHKCVFEWF